MTEQLQAGNAWSCAWSRLDRAPERIKQVLKAAQEQVFLILEVGVKRRTTHVGAVNDVLNGNRLVTLLQHQLQQRSFERLARAPRPPVVPRFSHFASFLFSLAGVSSNGQPG